MWRPAVGTAGLPPSVARRLARFPLPSFVPPGQLETDVRRRAEYGQCGVGAYCLGGCDPRMSASLDACVPAPVCQNKKFAMNSLDGVVDINKYLGDAGSADWVAQGEPLIYNGNMLLTMPANSVGTVLASTVNMWYGNVKAKVKTSRGAGVVTAFILLSDVKDEIDYEWVGTELDIAQTNYYFQGIPNCTSSLRHFLPFLGNREARLLTVDRRQLGQHLALQYL